MKYFLASFAVIALNAQQGEIIAPEKRSDVCKFAYVEYPHPTIKRTLAESYGKVVVLTFLAEGFAACSQSLKELNWLQDQEKSLGLLVIPIYDPSSRRLADTSSGVTGKVGQDLDRAGLLTNDVKDSLVGKGMFKNTPSSFRVFQEEQIGTQRSMFPKFESWPAIVIVDRKGRIATIQFGYKKGQITKAVQKILDEKN